MKKGFCVLFLFSLFTILLSNCSIEQTKKSDDGDKSSNTESKNYQEMVFITGGTYIQTDGSNSFTHTISDFSLGKYEVTYKLWYKVYQWAIVNGYSFANMGRLGTDGIDGAVPTSTNYKPVTAINWRDAMIWCNAYSQMEGLTPCYTYGGNVIKDSSNSNATACDNAECNWSANGYRLPTEGEWQFVSSNKGTTSSNYASGATASISNETETKKVAWYLTGGAKNVGTTPCPSALTFWDLSGNVAEWCWDWYDGYPDTTQVDYRGAASGSWRINRGGSCYSFSHEITIGKRSSFSPYDIYYVVGFRVAQSN